MSKMMYRVVSTGPSAPTTEIEIAASAYENTPGDVWTHAKAVTYVRTKTGTCSPGTTHAILRKKGAKGAWERVRVYVTTPQGYVERVDGVGLRGGGMVLAL